MTVQRGFTILLGTLVLTSGPALTAEPRARTAFTAADVFRLKGVGDTRISPDGAMVAYETSDADIMIDGRRHAVRLIDVATGRDRLLADGASSPRWSPDGRALAYLASGPSDATRVMVASFDGRSIRQIALIAGSPAALVWSPDGGTIAFTMTVSEPEPSTPVPVTQPKAATWATPLRLITGVRYEEDGQTRFEPGHVQLFTLKVATGTSRQITTAPLDVQGDPAWTPNGARLVYSAENLDALGPSFHVARLYSVSALGGAPVPISPGGLSAQMPAVAPDGRSVAFVGWAADGRDYSPARLYVEGIDSTPPRMIGAALDRDIVMPVWSSDGRSLYAVYGDHGVDKIGRFSRDDTGVEEIASGIDGGYTLSRDGVVAFAAGRSDRPAEVAVRRANGERTILTHRNDALLSDKALGIARPIAVRSSLDGAAVGAWLTVPPGPAAKPRYPLILDIHGGPYGYDSPVWRTRDQLYVAAGYAVLHVNYRGSTSYGFAFADRIAHDPLAPAYADLMSAVDAVVHQGVADAHRLFVTGGSAGGQLAAWIVGNTTRFRAAMVEKPIINATSQALTSDQYVTSEIVSGTKPWADPARFWAMSPLSRVAQVQTPTMLIVGEEDRRTPVGEAKQFYDALTLRRIPTALVIVPDAGHASIGPRPSQLAAITALTLDWFGRF